jgi:hypothetical protein
MNRMGASTIIACSLGLTAMWAASPTALASPLEPCQLLTQQQVSAALGMSVASGSAISSIACDWEGPAGSKVRVTLALWPATAWARMKTPLPNTTNTEVNGLGEDAFYAVTGPFTSLSVEKGDAAFILRVYGIHDPQKQRAVERSLASNVLAQM